MRDFIGARWEATLHQNGLDTFEALWKLDAEWVEAPNMRRGGWSGVARIQLKSPEGDDVGMYLKRQQNHFCHSPLRPLHKTLTFKREFLNFLHFQQTGIPSVEPIFFGQRQINGDHRAILLTRELDGFHPLSAEPLSPRAQGPLHTRAARKALFARLAELMRKMHTAHRQHSALHLKHVFVKPTGNNDFDVRIIDLEKARWQPLRSHAAFRDLYCLCLHAENWSRTDHMRFFLLYRQEQHLSRQSKKLWRAIAQKLYGKAQKRPQGNTNH